MNIPSIRHRIGHIIAALGAGKKPTNEDDGRGNHLQIGCSSDLISGVKRLYQSSGPPKSQNIHFFVFRPPATGKKKILPKFAPTLFGVKSKHVLNRTDLRLHCFRFEIYCTNGTCWQHVGTFRRISFNTRWCDGFERFYLLFPGVERGTWDWVSRIQQFFLKTKQ
jgi:hypothetical protein